MRQEELLGTYLEKIEDLSNENTDLRQKLAATQSSQGAGTYLFANLIVLGQGDKWEINRLMLELQQEKRLRQNLENEVQDLRRKLLEKESELETKLIQNADTVVLKATNERLHSELVSLQAQLKKLEAMNSSAFTMYNSAIVTPRHNQQKPFPQVAEEQNSDQDLMEQLKKI